MKEHILFFQKNEDMHLRLMDILKNKGYRENFINVYFKMFANNKQRIREKLKLCPRNFCF